MSIRVDAARALARLAMPRVIAALDAALNVVATEMHRLVSRYPPASRKPQPPRTARQRRKVMALVRAGKIPYRRTGNLGQKWSIRRLEKLRVAVENRASYARFVYGEPQAAYHAGTWISLSEARVQAARLTQREVKDVITRIFS